jgi:hypothetical protein
LAAVLTLRDSPAQGGVTRRWIGQDPPDVARRERTWQRTHLGQQLAAEHLGFDGPAAALVVGEENAAFAELFLEDQVFGA